VGQRGGIVLFEAARTLLRDIRVGSQQELRARIELYLKVNEEPVVFKWK
jgi:hypothetical protein